MNHPPFTIRQPLCFFVPQCLCGYIIPCQSVSNKSVSNKSVSIRVQNMNSFMQNKPNLQNGKMNVSYCLTMNYEQLSINYENKNKPK